MTLKQYYLPAVFAISLLFSCLPASAQETGGKWNMVLQGGLLQYRGPRGNEFFKLNESTAGFGVGVGRSLGRSFDLEFHFSGGTLDFPDEDGISIGFYSTVFDLGAQLVYKFANGYLLNENAAVIPIVFAGARGMRAKPGFGADFPVGAGFVFRFDELLSFQIRSAYKHTTSSEFNMFEHTIGFGYTFPGKTAE